MPINMAFKKGGLSEFKNLDKGTKLQPYSIHKWLAARATVPFFLL